LSPAPKHPGTPLYVKKLLNPSLYIV